MTVPTFRRVRYVENRIGMGQLMMGPETLRTAAFIARKVKAAIKIAAAQSEAEAIASGVVPGDVIAAFSRIRTEPTTVVIVDGGYPNRRRAVKLHATRGRLSAINGRTRSAAVTYEFGSKYNEGQKGDRPRLRPMRKGVLAVASVYDFVRAARLKG